MIHYIDRLTGKIEEEKVYGGSLVCFFYGGGVLGKWICNCISRCSFFSAFAGWWQRRAWTKRKILPFIETYGIDEREFLDPVESFGSFNDFFIRRLKVSSRPVDQEMETAAIPADGRYWFYPLIEKGSNFL